MSKKDKGKLPPFVAVTKGLMDTPAWRAMSNGARVLYLCIKRRWSFTGRNNGRLYLSSRDAQKEMGGTRDSISRWFRELEFYGFIVQTSPGSLGVDGKGRAPHWAVTEHEASGGRNGETWCLPTCDYQKWDGTRFRDDRGAVKRTREWRQKRRATKIESRPVH